MILPSRLRGQMLINTLIALAIFAILSQALFVLLSSSYSLINFTRARSAAKHLAEERIEYIRNLPYDQVGTSGGIPSGSLLQTEQVSLNGLNYTVNTLITYIDDAFDGYSPSDLLPIDYKRIRIDVSWSGLAASSKNPVTIVSDIAPKGVESVSGGGTLSILVFDSNAAPVPQAQVRIYSNQVSPTIDLTLYTNDNGRIVLPGTPACTGACYQITATKSGFSTDRTYATSEVANPNKPHVSVIESAITEVSFAIDRTSTLQVSSFDNESNSFSVLPNMRFSLRGTKTIGTNTQDQPVYKVSSNFQTDAQGVLEIPNIEWDNYEVILDTTDGYDLYGSNPYSPFSILPNQTIPLRLAFTDHTTHSLLTTFTDSSGVPIASVAATLKDNLTEATASSGLIDTANFGQVFFEDLSNQFYQIIATASGYSEYTGTISVAGNVSEIIPLTSQ